MKHLPHLAGVTEQNLIFYINKKPLHKGTAFCFKKMAI
jgi:hypothetical protein